MTPNDKLARLTGLAYLLMIPTSAFFLAYVPGQVFVKGDTAATLAGIQAHRDLFELGIVVGAFAFVDFLVLAFLLHRLFSPVGKIAAGLLLAFVAVSVPISLMAVAQGMDVLAMLDLGQRLTADQLQVQAMLTLARYNNLVLVSSIFWGLWLFPLGWLMFRAGFGLPGRILGVLLMVGSLGYVLAFAGPVLDPRFSGSLISRIARYGSGIPAGLGELGSCLWLLIFGARGLRLPAPAPAPAAATA